MSARSDWPELQSILIKALNAIGTQQRNAINTRWLDLEISRAIDYDMVWRWAAARCGLLLLLPGWHWSLQRKNAAQSAALRRTNRQPAQQGQVSRQAWEEARTATPSQRPLP